MGKHLTIPYASADVPPTRNIPAPGASPRVFLCVLFEQVYEDGSFDVMLEFPENFPDSPPVITFSEMYHPHGKMAELYRSVLLLLCQI